MPQLDFKRFALPLTILGVVVIIGALAGWYFYLDGKRAVLSAVEAGRGLSESLTSSFPVGSTYSNITGALGSAFGGNATSTEGNTARAPQLWKVGGAPTAGITWIESSSTPALRFMDRASGNIFDANPETSIIERRTNTLVPKVVEAIWTESDTVIARFDGVAGVESFSATIRPSTTTTEAAVKEGPGTLEGTALPRGIAWITPELNGSRIFYLIPFNGEIAGIIAKGDGTSPKRIWTSPIEGWLPQWAGDHIVLVQKPAYGVNGSAYRLSQSGVLTPIITARPGLFAKEHPTGGSILYSTVSRNSSPALAVRTGEGAVSALPFSTLADKCAWDPSSTTRLYCAVPRSFGAGVSLPDAWYRGEVHFSDTIWMYDLASGDVAEVIDPARGAQGRTLDILDPVISPDGNYMAFIDAPSGEAWVLRLK